MEKEEEEKLAEQVDWPNANIPMLHMLPRKNAKVKPAPNEFDPENEEYVQGVATYIVPGAFLAVLSLITGITFCIMRYGCNSCGGKKMSDEFRYNKKFRLFLMITMGLFSLVAGVMCILMAISTGPMTKNINNTISAAASAVASLQTGSNEMYGLYTRVDPDNVPEAAFEQLNNAILAANDATGAAQDTVKPVDDARSLFTIFSIGFTLISITCGFFAAMLRKGILATFMMVFGFITLVFVWIGFAVHFPIAVGIADLCWDAELFLEGILPPTSGLAFILTCIDRSSLVGLEDPAKQGLTSTTAQIDNDNFVETLNLYIGYQSSLDVYDANPLAKQNLLRLDDELNDPENNNVNRGPQLAVQIEAALIYTDIVDDLQMIKNCTRVTEAYTTLREPFCNDTLQSVYSLGIFNAIIGSCFIPLTIIAILGSKRFKKTALHLKMDDDTAGRSKAQNEFEMADAKDARDAKKKEDYDQL